ncbi:MAG TPA: hypothetical protein VFN31_00380 [Candidatus Saccharimonadales bacterium]|nr:hypothetical protein [Candidatus Saccharimonadales bacterium]
MHYICPTVTAFNEYDYKAQINLLKEFAARVHIDLMDGEFTPSKSPDLKDVWWPKGMTADIHLMYKQPEKQLSSLIKLKPNLVIFHYEAEVDHAKFAQSLKAKGIKAGLALLQATKPDQVLDMISSFDQILIFSGHLGYHGGVADLSLIDKVRQLRQASPDIEIAWDGGINDKNIADLTSAGVDILNVGDFIHSSTEPASAYAKLEALAG